jgi:5-methyltetrahydropteroyltriglutamate--homocysteine methyltransferase
MAQQAKDEHYKDEAALAMAYADAVNAEARELKAAGADVIQLDEPYLQAQPEKAREYAIAAINRALAGVPGPTVVHLCFGYAYIVKGKPSGYSFLPELAQTSADQISIEAAQPQLDLGILRDLAPKIVMLGVLDLGDPAVETPETVADRIRRALDFASPDRIVPAPDCGMKYLPRVTAFGKLKALADGAAMVRRELMGGP